MAIGRFVTNYICPRRYVTKGAICTKVYGRFVTLFVGTWTICHHFILDDLSQVIFVLDDMSQKRNSDLWRYVGRYGRFATIVFSGDDLSQLFLVGTICHNCFSRDDLSQLFLVGTICHNCF